MMNQHNIPNVEDLPSNRKLLLTSVFAALVGAALLVLFVMPAEYARDPSGIGEKFGLLEMGQIKVQLAKEALADTNTARNEGETPSASSKLSAGQRRISLAPGKAAELKLIMRADHTASYSWQVDQGHLNVDVHGDSAEVDYHNYLKSKAQTQGSGQIKAAFDGKHGWYWRNRSDKKVTLTINFEGHYSGIKRVL